MGVTLQLDAKVADLAQTMKDGGFDAAFLAVGAHIAKRAYIPAKDSSRILDAVSVLRSMEGEDKPMLGRRVVVYGGGNTAIDVARTAKRLGATEAIIVYRRTREKMPAHDFEVEEALEEGVMVKWLSTIKQADERRADDREDGARRQGQPAADRRVRDAGGRLAGAGARPGRGPVAARRACPAWRSADGVVQVDPATMMTGAPGPVRRRRHGAGRAQRHRGGRPRQEGRAPHRRLAARHAHRAGAQARGRRPSTG